MARHWLPLKGDRKRRSPTEREKRAATCLMHRDAGGRYIVTRAEAEHMTPAEILALYDSRVVYAHGAHDALGGSMHPSNLWPTRRSEDAPQTRKDIGSIAKTKRQRRRQATHDAAIARKSGQAIDLAMIPVDVRGHMADMPARDERRAWPSRSFPKRPKTKWSKRPFPKRRRGR